MESQGRAIAVAAMLIIAASIVAAGQSNMAESSRPHGGSLNVQRHGYEHGYRDGFQFGQYDASRKAVFNYKTNQKYSQGDAGYQNFMGDRGQFVQGYQTGFRSGYTDGFYGSPGRVAQIFGKPSSEAGQNASVQEAEDKTDDIYVSKGWSATDVAYDIGYRDGVLDGENDKINNADKEPTYHAHYTAATHGYRVDYGVESEYQRLYRIAYRRGYADGFQAVREAPNALKFVSDPGVEKHTDTLAIVGWSTNADTTGVVYYTANGFNYDQAVSSTKGLVHRVELKNLKAGTTYTIFVRSKHNDLTKTSPEFQLTTSPKTTLILFTSDGIPKVEEVNTNSVVIRWKTNIDSSGSVLYRTSPEGPSKLAEELSLSTDHRVKITNLSPGTKYYFTIWSSPVCVTNHEKFTFETPARQQVAGKIGG
jgi:hypothetical protein